MGASVDIFCAFDLWNTICEKTGTRTTSSGNCGFPGDHFQAFLRCFLHGRLPQVVLVRVKPQDIKPYAKNTPSIPLRRSRL